MNNKNKYKKQRGFVRLSAIIIIAILVAIDYFVFSKNLKSPSNSNISHSRQISDENAWKRYTNDKYAFELTLLDSWKGYSVFESSWDGEVRDKNDNIDRPKGPVVVIRNPNWTAEKHWEDIPIMVFTPEQWRLIEEGKLSVSAAPVGPWKLGQNQRYVFALPPRWIGYTDDLGQDEALLITKSFKVLADNGVICIQVITPARNPKTGEIKDFPTPCDVPPGWELIQK